MSAEWPPFVNPKLTVLYRYWRQRCLEDGPMPRSRLDPVELPGLLSNLMVLEVPADGGEIRFRLAGEEIEQRYGRSLRGLRLSDIFPMVRRKDTSHQWAEILRDARPKYRRGPMAFPEGRVYEAERLLLPLSEGERRVSHILGAIYYLPLSPQAFEDVAVVATLED
ncbi:MAG: PAS domain-containing protein [Tistlia sp.]|uniref:PAS domain-containing protein n=1 Tax=Tistlia sp. TaxID=3057121 RepID=UPI0034A2C182